MSKQILQSAHLDYKLSVRLAGVNDLIAAEGKYHLICLRAYDPEHPKISSGTGRRVSFSCPRSSKNKRRYDSKRGSQRIVSE